MWRCLCHLKRTRALGWKVQNYWCDSDGKCLSHWRFFLDLYNELVKSTRVGLRERGMKKVSIVSAPLGIYGFCPPEELMWQIVLSFRLLCSLFLLRFGNFTSWTDNNGTAVHWNNHILSLPVLDRHKYSQTPICLQLCKCSLFQKCQEN